MTGNIFLLLPPRSLRRFLLLGLCCTLIILSQGFWASASELDQAQAQKAEKLTHLGHAHLHGGAPGDAIKDWEAAYEIYKRLNNVEAMSGILINKNLAFQALGFYPDACESLLQALKLEKENWICDHSIKIDSSKKKDQDLKRLVTKTKQPSLQLKAKGLQNLGEVLRLLGEAELSENALKIAREMASSLPPETTNRILLSLANTEIAFYAQARNRYRLTEEPIAKQNYLKIAQSKYNSAIELYQKIDLVEARLNQLRLLLETEDLVSSSQTKHPIIRSLVQELLATHNFDNLPEIDSIYKKLNFVESLIKIAKKPEISKMIFSDEKANLETALSLAQNSFQLAKKLDNQRAKSYSLGIIGNIYNQMGQTSLYKKALNKALELAQSVDAWDIEWQWQQELGRLYKQSGEFNKAIQAYGAAVFNLAKTQNNLLSVNSDIQFSFRNKVEPVYQEYLELLLSKEQPDLKQAIQVKEQLQLAELENFLKCGKISTISSLEKQSFTDRAPRIYLFNLGKQVELIVKTQEGLLVRHRIDSKTVTNLVDAYVEILQTPQFSQVIKEFTVYSQALYNLIITPIKKSLPASGTLVFVTDSYFQNIPFAMLSDGQKYLVESYSISNISSSLMQPVTLNKSNKLKVLIAGISSKNQNVQVSENFESLPEVEMEIEKIKASNLPTRELLNQEFTSDRLKEQIKKDFPIIHISTHGQFSSDPEKTFILAWDKAIKVQELSSLLRNELGIDLLILSACQTAKGDRYSALGIAGVSVQAGARSTLASLWQVDAGATAQLMGEFYSYLKKGVSKADALRQAQLSLLSNPKYNHPYFWAAFILVGSYL